MLSFIIPRFRVDFFSLHGLLLAVLLGMSDASHASPIKLLFVGDSITAGVCDGFRFTYREPLLQDLESDGYSIDAIGHLTSAQYPGACYTFADGDHSSIPGWTADELVVAMQMELSGLDSPDLAIVFAGVNDLNQLDTPAEIVIDLHNIMNEIWAKNPETEIFLSNVLDNVSWGPGVPAMNVEISSYFGAMAQVTIMDLNSVFVLGVDDSDGLHPSLMGAQKLADAIRSILLATIDNDFDNVAYNEDLCANTASGQFVDAKGCSDVQVDSDGDTYCDPDAPSGGPSLCTGSDAFPDDPAEWRDNDSDGVGDNADPDDDNDQVADMFDSDPLTANNNCTGGTIDNSIFAGLVSSGATCAARVSILVSPPTEVQSPGHLRLIAPTVTFQPGFKAGMLTVISADPCPSC